MYDPDISSTSSIKAMLIVMLNLLFRIWKQNGGVIEPRSEMDTVDIWEIMRYMELHCKDVSLSEVAFRFGYNIFYLSKLIKKRTGHNFTELKQRACIEYAKNMLVTSNVPIQEIAIQSGFSNITHFYTVFKKYYSITPADYRRDFLKESPKPVKL
jgi:YesN/AraC family two-component response regulator